MIKKEISFTFPLLLLFFFVLTGCQTENRPADMPALYPCVLTFTQEGKPLEKALIYLQPEDPAIKWSVGAITNASGVAEIVTHGQFRGAPEGEYKIVITKEENVQEKGANAPPADPEMSEEYTAGGGMISVYSLVEKEYTDKSTTPLSITITKGKNNQDIDCGKAERVLLRTVAP